MLDILEIMKRIPHRYPFLLVDRILEMDRENQTIKGKKNVTMNEEFFNGHFPGQGNDYTSIIKDNNPI